MKRKIQSKNQPAITDFFKKAPVIQIYSSDSSDSEDKIVYKKKKKNESFDEEKEYCFSENNNSTEKENEDEEEEYQFSKNQNLSQEEKETGDNKNNSVIVKGSTLSFTHNEKEDISSEQYSEGQTQNKKWLETSIKNLRKKSERTEETDNLLQQFNLLKTQWGYVQGSWSISDRKDKCELCNHENIVYEFPIINIKNEKTLDVGSSCIFQFRLFDQKENKLLSKEESREKIKEDYEEATGERKNDLKVRRSYIF